MKQAMKLTVVAPLPPARTGPAPYLVSLLPALSRAADLTLCAPDVEAVSPELRDRWDVRGLDARFAADAGLVVYHLANNPWHAEVNAAAMEGPAGLVVVHDASLHHLQIAQTLGAGDARGYVELMASGHGSAGRELAELAVVSPSGPLAFERFLFDLLGPVLERHLGAQVHSRYAADLLRRRCPGLPVHVVPLAAPSPVMPADLGPLGIPAGRTVLGHAGFVTAPKRYDVMCAALAGLLAEGLDVHLLLAGEDGTAGDLARVSARLGVQDRVTCTGWQSEDDFDRTVAAFDIALSLRWPHVGESSATLAALLANGVAVVAEPVGSWAEFPPDVVARADLSEHAVDGLVAAVRPLAQDRAARAAWGERARRYARDELSLQRCADGVLEACRQVGRSALTPVAYAGLAAQRKGSALDAAKAPARMAGLPSATPGQCLLAVGAPADVLAVLPAFGYEVCEAPPRLMPTGSVDVVTLWVEPDPELLAEVHRVLVPGGVLHHPEAVVSPYGLTPVGPGLARKTGPVLAPRMLLSLPHPA